LSSACYVYAIVSRDTPLPIAATGAELALVPWRALAAITRRLGEAGARLTMDAVLHHEAVVEAVRQQGPALPVRFGTVFPDEPSVASAIAQRYEPLVADLDRLGDKVELSLTALWAASPFSDGHTATTREEGRPEGQGAGARYLHARAAELRVEDAVNERARAVAEELDEVLGGLALERRASVLPTPRIAVRAAYLLESAGVSGFQKAFEGIRETRGDLRVLLTGPWPPYSFVMRREAEGGGASGDRLAALVQQLTNSMPGRPG
jgi:hypothetical protein